MLLLTLGVLVTGQIYRFRLALVGLLATLTALWCDAAATFYYCEPCLLGPQGHVAALLFCFALWSGWVLVPEVSAQPSACTLCIVQARGHSFCLGSCPWLTVVRKTPRPLAALAELSLRPANSLIADPCRNLVCVCVQCAFRLTQLRLSLGPQSHGRFERTGQAL